MLQLIKRILTRIGLVRPVAKVGSNSITLTALSNPCFAPELWRDEIALEFRRRGLSLKETPHSLSSESPDISATILPHSEPPSLEKTYTPSLPQCWDAHQAAKEHTFKPLYGGQSGTPKQKAYYKAFREKYPDIYKTQKGWTLDVARDKYLRTATGLRFYWPDTRISADGYVSGTPKIFNYPVQSLATADIIPLTLALVWHRMVDVSGAVLVNTIHDSIVGECPVDKLDAYVDVLIDCFTSRIYVMLERLYGIKFSMPLGVAVKAGTHWSEGEEKKYEPRWLDEAAAVQADAERQVPKAKGTGKGKGN